MLCCFSWKLENPNLIFCYQSCLPQYSFGEGNVIALCLYHWLSPVVRVEAITKCSQVPGPGRLRSALASAHMVIYRIDCLLLGLGRGWAMAAHKGKGQF